MDSTTRTVTAEEGPLCCCCNSLFRQSVSQVVFCAYEIFLIILTISFKPKLLKCNLTLFSVNDLIVTLNLLVFLKGTYFHKSVIKREANPKEYFSFCFPSNIRQHLQHWLEFISDYISLRVVGMKWLIRFQRNLKWAL